MARPRGRTLRRGQAGGHAAGRVRLLRERAGPVGAGTAGEQERPEQALGEYCASIAARALVRAGPLFGPRALGRSASAAPATPYREPVFQELAQGKSLRGWHGQASCPWHTEHRKQAFWRCSAGGSWLRLGDQGASPSRARARSGHTSPRRGIGHTSPRRERGLIRPSLARRASIGWRSGTLLRPGMGGRGEAPAQPRRQPGNRCRPHGRQRGRVPIARIKGWSGPACCAGTFLRSGECRGLVFLAFAGRGSHFPIT